MQRTVRNSGNNARIRFVALAVIWASASIPAWGSQRTDVIYLKNGEKLTGEIRLFQDGILQFKCDFGEGRFNIYWDQIVRLETKKILTVELTSGERMRGTVTTKPSGEMTVQDLSGRKLEFSLPEVAWMHEGERGFLGHFDGNLDAGYSLTRSNTTQQISLNGDLLFNSVRYLAKASFGMIVNTQDDVDATQRYQGELTLQRMLGEKWYAFGAADFLQSDELQLDLRSVLGGGVGKIIKRDFRHSFTLGGGAAWNREIYFNPDISNQNSPEAVFVVRFDAFNLLDDNLDLINQMIVYKSLSHGSRTRIDLNVGFRWSLPKHLYFNTSFSNNFDSSPIGDTSRNDFVLTTGFGWSP